ncbi:hypothetical protein [Streptomyces sp. NPDC005017]|uniref:hypothetical protein n=1 Tax=Streptomyces sp. NPDC005017 TaxID=3364706 RepID=UPI0036BBB067
MVALSDVRFGRRNEDVRTVRKALVKRGRRIPDGVPGCASYADGVPGCASLTTLGRHVGFAYGIVVKPSW